MRRTLRSVFFHHDARCRQIGRTLSHDSGAMSDGTRRNGIWLGDTSDLLKRFRPRRLPMVTRGPFGITEPQSIGSWLAGSGSRQKVLILQSVLVYTPFHTPAVPVGASADAHLADLVNSWGWILTYGPQESCGPAVKYGRRTKLIIRLSSDLKKKASSAGRPGTEPEHWRRGRTAQGMSFRVCLGRSRIGGSG